MDVILDYLYSIRNILNQICIAIRAVVNTSNVQNISDEIGEIGFGARFSLVILNADIKPLSISPTNDPSHDIILWMDRRVDIPLSIKKSGHCNEYVNQMN